MESNSLKPQNNSDKNELTNGSGIFPLSRVTVKGISSYRDQKLLLAAYYLTRDLMSSDMGNGEYKFNFIPAEGASTIFVSSPMWRGDESAGKTITRVQNGEPISVGFFRLKADQSILEKMIRKLGGAVMTGGGCFSETLDSVTNELASEIHQRNANPDLAASLAPLYGLLLSEAKGREGWVLRLCENDKKNAGKATDHLGLIGNYARMLKKVKSDYDAKAEKMDPNLTVSKLVGAADLWPIDEKEAERISELLPPDKRKELYKWAKNYCQEILPRVLGVELLEHTNFAMINEFQCLVNRAIRSSGKGAGSMEKIEEIDKEFHTLVGLVNAADSDFKKMKYWVGESAEQWLGAACKQAARRKKAVETLQTLEQLANQLDHNQPFKQLFLLILANISVNLCRTSEAEVEAWGDFSEKFKKDLKSKDKSKDMRHICAKAEQFVSAAEAESERISHFKENTEKEYRAYQAQKTELHRSILDRIDMLSQTSPKIGGVMREAYGFVISHVGHKQGETLSTSPANAYMSWRALAKSIGADASDSGKKIYSLLSQDRKLREEVLTEMDRLLHYQTRGFDIESPTDYWTSKGFTQQKLNVKYEVKEKLKDGEYKNMLMLEVKNREIEIELHGKLPYDEGFEPESYIRPPTRKTVEEEIFGKKYVLKDLIDLKDTDGLGEIYEKLHRVAVSEPDLVKKVREKLVKMDLETAHFLSTFMGEEERFGVVSDKFGRSLPRALNPNSEITFEQFLKDTYPDLEESKKEVKQYLRIKTAAREIQMLDMNIAHYAKKYFEAMKKELKEAKGAVSNKRF